MKMHVRPPGTYPAIATHDEPIINQALRYARREGIGPDRFEFQMLYGIRRDLQRRLIGLGYRLRLYVPYGTAWYPYFMRRLAERPANALFVAHQSIPLSTVRTAPSRSQPCNCNHQNAVTEPRTSVSAPRPFSQRSYKV